MFSYLSDKGNAQQQKIIIRDDKKNSEIMNEYFFNVTES